MSHTRIWSSEPRVPYSVVPPKHGHQWHRQSTRSLGRWNSQPFHVPVTGLDANETWLREIGHNQSMDEWFCALEPHCCKILDKTHHLRKTW